MNWKKTLFNIYWFSRMHVSPYIHIIWFLNNNNNELQKHIYSTTQDICYILQYKWNYIYIKIKIKNKKTNTTNRMNEKYIANLTKNRWSSSWADACQITRADSAASHINTALSGLIWAANFGWSLKYSSLTNEAASAA
jgi:hypothetical protein